MEKFGITSPQKVVDAAKRGYKLGVFAMDSDEKPISLLSDIKFTFSHEYSKTAQVLEPALVHIRNYYNKDIRMETLCDLCDLSVGYFSRLFKAELGVSLVPYITALRLEHAKLLLKTTAKSVVSIAYEVGYLDCGYFNKVFKKNLGVSPLQYRFMA